MGREGSALAAGGSSPAGGLSEGRLVSAGRESESAPTAGFGFGAGRSSPVGGVSERRLVSADRGPESAPTAEFWFRLGGFSAVGGLSEGRSPPADRGSRPAPARAEPPPSSASIRRYSLSASPSRPMAASCSSTEGRVPGSENPSLSGFMARRAAASSGETSGGRAVSRAKRPFPAVGACLAGEC